MFDVWHRETLKKFKAYGFVRSEQTGYLFIVLYVDNQFIYEWADGFMLAP